jgi:HEAT repeat protein
MSGRAFVLLGVLALAGTLWSGAAEGPERSAAEYARDLEASDRNVRREAAYRLSRMGREARVAIPELIKALDDDQQQVWFGAISALANLGPDAEPALPALLKELEAWQPFRKDRQGSQALYRTALALGSIGAPAVPALSNALASDKWFVKAGAARALGFAGDLSRPVVPALIRVVGDERVEVREAAAETLALHRDAAVAGLVTLLTEDEEPRARAAAAGTLRRIGTNAVSALPALRTAAEKDRDSGVRVEAMTALSRCGLPAGEWVSLLFQAARDPSEPVRKAAFGLLLVVRPVETRLMPTLIAGLRTADPGERELAARLVTELGADARSAAAVLVETLQTSASAGRGPEPALTRALAALGEAGVRPVFADLGARRSPVVQGTNDWRLLVLRQATALAIPAMVEGLTNPAPVVRVAALEGLAGIGSAARSVARKLPPYLVDTDPSVRAAAWAAAAACGVSSERLLEAIEGGLQDASMEVRRSVVLALGHLGSAAKPAVPRLIREIGAADEPLRTASVRALGSLGPEAAAAVEPLAAALESATGAARLELLAALGAIGSDAAPALARMSASLSDPEPGVRRAAAEALGRLRAAAKPAMSGLEAALKDSDTSVRSAALEAMAAVDPEAAGTLEAVVRGLEDAEERVRRSATTALVALGEKGRPAEARLFAMLGNAGDRELAKEALRAIHPTTMASLLELLKHTDWSLRELGADALARLGKGGAEAVPALEKLMRDDPQDEVKRAARRAVRRIKEG